MSTFSSNSILDILIIGGGINGSGIAADASSRGLRTGLFDSFDFGAATSSCSSKLIHGGLRYLEQFEFKLVAHSLKEREILLKKAPHIVSEMRFILPHRPFLRSAWIIRLGLFLYDHLGRRRLVADQGVLLRPRASLMTHAWQRLGLEESKAAPTPMIASKEEGDAAEDLEEYQVSV